MAYIIIIFYFLNNSNIQLLYILCPDLKSLISNYSSFYFSDAHRRVIIKSKASNFLYFLFETKIKGYFVFLILIV